MYVARTVEWEEEEKKMGIRQTVFGFQYENARLWMNGRFGIRK